MSDWFRRDAQAATRRTRAHWMARATMLRDLIASDATPAELWGAVSVFVLDHVAEEACVQHRMINDDGRWQLKPFAMLTANEVSEMARVAARCAADPLWQHTYRADFEAIAALHRELF